MKTTIEEIAPHLAAINRLLERDFVVLHAVVEQIHEGDCVWKSGRILRFELTPIHTPRHFAGHEFETDETAQTISIPPDADLAAIEAAVKAEYDRRYEIAQAGACARDEHGRPVWETSERANDPASMKFERRFEFSDGRSIVVKGRGPLSDAIAGIIRGSHDL